MTWKPPRETTKAPRCAAPSTILDSAESLLPGNRRSAK
jgi:hypothetical protein